MTGSETKAALARIAKEEVAFFEEKLAALPDENTTEKKALRISHNMAELCATFAEMFLGRKDEYQLKERRVFQNHYFDDSRAEYDALTDEEAKNSFIAYAFAVSMIRMNFYEKRKNELELADSAENQTPEDVKKAFEARLICNVLDSILTKWRAWWAENGCISAEERD